MRIGYYIGGSAVVSGFYNGVLQQALSYKEALKIHGIEVVCISPWEGHRLSEFDIVHVFGCGFEIKFLTHLHRNSKVKIVLSPIIDSMQRNAFYRIYSSMSLPALNIYNPGSITRQALCFVTKVWARSRHEYEKICRGLGVNEDMVSIVPVCLRISTERKSYDREKSCFHVSSYYQKRKNIFNLIEATKRAGIKLYLAGNVPYEYQKTRDYQRIIKNDHVEVLGRLTDEQLISYYQKMAVFALPSTSEGVGLVAMEAGYYGSEVVITKNGGPKDYFGDFAHYVDPKSITSIEHAIIAGMDGDKQPDLGNYIKQNYSQEVVGRILIDEYKQLL